MRVRPHRPRGVRPLLTLLALLSVPFAAAAAAETGASGASGERHFRELRRFPASAAQQAVAVDAGHVYVVGTRRIEKYARSGGAPLASWSAGERPIVHLNSGIVLEGRLYCAHSNYPGVPMLSSIEIFDAEDLTHVGSHSFGIGEGSATWVDRRDDYWWVGFAHYDGRGGEPGKGPAWTRVVRYDDAWRRVESWAFPEEVVRRFAGRSNSGGAWRADGLLYATGHDAAEVYVLRLPSAGPVLELVDILPAPIAGQGIAWDPTDPSHLWGIVKSDRTVLEMELVSD
jgi:hypothetical protein